MRNIKINPIVLFLILSSSLIVASDFRVQQIPNGAKNGCLNCHVSSAGGGNRNLFGQMVEKKYLDSGGNVKWGAAMAAEDPDGDGFTNGQELQDPAGAWKIGQANPGNASLVTLPGNSNSKPTSIENSGFEMPVTYRLEQNYPNPFNPETVINWQIAANSHVTLKVFSILGKEVATLVDEIKQPGIYHSTFSAIKYSIPSGIYFYRLSANDFIETKKFVLLK